MTGVAAAGQRRGPASSTVLRLGVPTVSDECQLDRVPADPDPPAASCQTVPMPAEMDIGNADDLRQRLVSAVDRGFAVVIADLTDTLFCDCAAVTALLIAGQYAATVGAEVRIVARARPVLRTFELTELAGLLAVYPDVEAAIGGSVFGRARPMTIPALAGLSSRRRTGLYRSGPQRRQRRSP